MMNETKKEAEKAKKAAEIAKKIVSAEGDLKRKKEFLAQDIKNGRDPGRNTIEVKYKAKRVESLKKEHDRLH